MGIRWSAVDFERGTISINHKVTEGKVDGKETLFIEDKLKTKTSFRTLPLISAVRELLLEQKKTGTLSRPVQKVLLHRLLGLCLCRRDGPAVPAQLRYGPF